MIFIKFSGSQEIYLFTRIQQTNDIYDEVIIFVLTSVIIYNTESVKKKLKAYVQFIGLMYKGRFIF